MTTDFRSLCAELVDAIDSSISVQRIFSSPLMQRTRAALAEPEPELPTDGELLRTYGLAKRDHCYEGPIDDWPKRAERAATIAGLRAVLARWGSSAPQPVPVSERLPGPDDCNADGRCWLGGEMFAPGDPTWVLGFPSWAQKFPEIHRYWLPAHAMPLPSKNINGES